MSKSLIPQRLTWRAVAALLVHTAVFAAVYWFSFWNAYDFRLTSDERMMFYLTIPAILIVKLVCFYMAGHCHRSWHHIAFSDLGALLRSATLATLVIAAADGALIRYDHIPRRCLGLDWGLTILVLGCLRAFMRLVREELRPDCSAANTTRP